MPAGGGRAFLLPLCALHRLAEYQVFDTTYSPSLNFTGGKRLCAKNDWINGAGQTEVLYKDEFDNCFNAIVRVGGFEKGVRRMSSHYSIKLYPKANRNMPNVTWFLKEMAQWIRAEFGPP